MITQKFWRFLLMRWFKGNWFGKNLRQPLASALGLIVLASVVCFTRLARADDFADTVEPIFSKYCSDCHSDDTTEGDLDLGNLRPDFSNSSSLQAWVEVLDRVNLGEMPPEDSEQPSATELAKLTDWISARLSEAQAASESTGGRVLLRRLSRLEYANTVRDLLGVQFVEGKGPLDLLPPDGSIRGFDRNSRSLLVDPSLMDAYLRVAEEVAAKAIRFRPPPIPTKTVRFEFRDTVGSAMEYLIHQRSADIEDDRMVLMAGQARTFAKLRHPFNEKEVPATAKYRIRVKASARKGADGEPVYMFVKQGPGEPFGQVRVDAPIDEPEVYEFVTTRDALFQGEYDIGIAPEHQFQSYVPSRGNLVQEARKAFEDGKLLESTRLKARLRTQGDMDGDSVRSKFHEKVRDLDELPKLYLDWIEVTGPLQESYPPKSMTGLFPNGWSDDKLTPKAIRTAFSRLMPRAFRRRVIEAEIDAVTDLVQSELDSGMSYERAIRTGVVAVLCSPNFLYLYEPKSKSDGSRKLSQVELASRLSYFLWSSKPDDRLFSMALKGQLSSRAALRKSVDRMLADERFEGFVDGFVRQWLKVNQFDQFPADERIYPDFYKTEFVGLENDITEQPLAMFREILKGDESILNFLDSDWTMLNERLANYYGVDGVEGDSFQRVELDDDIQMLRGGLLGMAGIHRWGSDGSRTKPVERGKYILDVLFNDPPPPPPPNAGEVEPNLGGKKLTVRERLKLHREQTTCNNCHRRIDPYGLALENFNVVGLWRERLDGERPIEQWGDDRPKIDPTGRLPNGDSFQSFREFKMALLKQDERFVRGLTEKLLMYALARTPVASDRAAIEKIVSNAKENGYTMRSLIYGIVESRQFWEK